MNAATIRRTPLVREYNAVANRVRHGTPITREVLDGLGAFVLAVIGAIGVVILPLFDKPIPASLGFLLGASLTYYFKSYTQALPLAEKPDPGQKGSSQ